MYLKTNILKVHYFLKYENAHLVILKDPFYFLHMNLFDVCDLFCITYRSPQHNYREDKLGWKSVPFLKSCAHSSLFHAGPGTLWLHESVL